MSPILNVQAYRESYEDLDKAFGDNWDAYVEHYFTFGVNERRKEGVYFDPLEYADSYGDIKAAFGNDINAIVRHYLDHGIEENRTEGTAGFYKDLAVKQETEERIAWEEEQERIAQEEAEREAEEAAQRVPNMTVDPILLESFREEAESDYQRIAVDANDLDGFCYRKVAGRYHDYFRLDDIEWRKHRFLALYKVLKENNPSKAVEFLSTYKVDTENLHSDLSEWFIPDYVLENL